MSYSFLFHYGALNYFNVYMANGVFPRVFSSLGILKCLACFMYLAGLLPARFKAEGV